MQTCKNYLDNFYENGIIIFMIVKRAIFNKLFSQLKNRAISILIGARQVGKSTLLSEMQKQISKPCKYINLENPLHLKIFADGYTGFVNEIKEDVILIDEFHYYENITSVFKAIYDLNPEKKIYASGSSSIEIHKHLKESLAGRKIHNNIFPLCFSEWLKQYSIDLPGLEEYISLETKNVLDKCMGAFLTYGTMPGLIGLEDEIGKREYLFDIYKTYIAKDIKSFLKEESILSFNKIIEYLAINNTCQLNMNTLSRVAGISMRQVIKQIEVMNGTYVIGLLKPLYNNKTKEITKTSKVFFYDQGIANVITGDFRSIEKKVDRGSILEQFVYWELVKSLDIRFNLRYWRTVDKKEVDFVVERDRKYLPIEVKGYFDTNRVPAGLKAFFKYYPETKIAVILTDCQDKQIQFNNKTIYFKPWYRAYFLKELL